jgi:hypothetical protein
MWHSAFARHADIPGVGDFTGDGKDDLVRFTRGPMADVFVVRSTGTQFADHFLWHDWFAPQGEVPAGSSTW